MPTCQWRASSPRLRSRRSAAAESSSIFEELTCAAHPEGHACDACVAECWTCTLLPRRVRKLFEVDFFARCQAKGFLPRTAHRWNLGSLAYFILFTQQRLTIKAGAGGSEVYGNLKDTSSLALRSSVERLRLTIESLCTAVM